MNFSNYAKETFTPKLNDLYRRKWKAKKKSQGAFAKAMNELYEKYDIRDRTGEEVRTCTHQQVSKWLNGTFPEDDNLRCICELLGVKPEYFTSATEKELYEFSQGFMTDIGENRLLPYCEEIGLDPQLLVVVNKLFGDSLGEEFPFWTPITVNHMSVWIIDPDKVYRRPDPVDFWSGSAEMNPDVEMFQIEVKRDDSDEKKRLTLSYSDLLFLRDVQEEIRDYIEFLFLKRKKELKSECEEACRRARKPLKGGGYSIEPLKAEELIEIDKYCDRYVDKNKVRIQKIRREKNADD